MRRRTLLRAGLAACAAGVLGAWLTAGLLGLRSPQAVLRYAEVGGPWGVLTMVVGIALLCAVLVPRSVLMITAGLILSPPTAIACCVAGATLGAMAAYGIGRLAKRGDLAALGPHRLTRLRQWVSRADSWMTRRGVLGVVAARLLPGMPYGFTSYALGLSGVGWWPFVVGTMIGVAPSAVLYVALGAAAGTGSTSVWLSGGALVMVMAWIAAMRYRQRYLA